MKIKHKINTNPFASSTKAYHHSILLINLIQLLLGCSLVIVVKISRIVIYPGHDYFIFTFYCILYKLLQTRKDSVLQDLAVLTPLTFLAYLLTTNSGGSVFESTSILLNYFLLILPLSLICFAVILLTSNLSLVVILTLSSCISYLMRWGKFLVSLICIISISMVLIQIGIYQEKSSLNTRPHTSTSNVNENTKITHELHLSFGSQCDRGHKYIHFRDTLGHNNRTNNVIKATESGEKRPCILSSLHSPVIDVNNNKSRDIARSDIKTNNTSDKLSDELHKSKYGEDSFTFKHSDHLSGTDKVDKAFKYEYFEQENTNNLESTKDCDNSATDDHDDYLVFDSVLESDGHCSLDILDISNENSLVKSFYQLNILFHRLFPIFPAHTPIFQLKRVSLMGFTHLCLYLPGSQLSFVNLGIINESSEEKNCQCDTNKNKPDVFYHVNDLFSKLSQYVSSLF